MKQIPWGLEQEKLLRLKGGPHSHPILAWLLSGLGSLSCDSNRPAWEARRSGSIHSFTRIHLLSSVLIAGHTTLAVKELPVGGRQTDQS